MTESKKNLEEMRQFINDSRSICDDLMQQCSDIETLFVENGYVSPKEEVENFRYVNLYLYQFIHLRKKCF